MLKEGKSTKGSSKELIPAVIDAIVKDREVLAKQWCNYFKQGTEEAKIRGVAFLMSAIDALTSTENSLDFFKKHITDRGGAENENDQCFDAFVFVGDIAYIIDSKAGKYEEVDVVKFLDSVRRWIGSKESLQQIKYPQLVKYLKKARKKRIRLFVIRGDFHGSPDDLLKAKSIQAKLEGIHQEHDLFSSSDFYIYGSTYLINQSVKASRILPPFLAQKEAPVRKLNDGSSYSYALVPIEEIVKYCILLESKGFEFATDLVNENVRLPYENNSDFVENLRNTLESGKDFSIFHNGVTFVGSLLSVEQGEIKLSAPQIVNGAQTIEALMEIYKEYPKVLKKHRVLCKFIGTTDRSLVSVICETANTQRKVTNWDLRSNDIVALALDKLFSGRGFTRKSGPKKKREHVLKEDYFKWFWASVHGKPHEAKTKKGKLASVLSDGLYKQISQSMGRTKAIDHESIYDIGLYVRQKRKTVISKEESKWLSYADMHLIYVMYILREKYNELETSFKESSGIIRKAQSIIVETHPEWRELQIFSTKPDLTNEINKNIYAASE